MNTEGRSDPSERGNIFFAEALLYLFPAIAFLLWCTPIMLFATYGLLEELLSLSFNEARFDRWEWVYLLMVAYYVGVILIMALMRLAILSSRNRILKFDKMARAILVGWIYCAACIYFYLDWRALLIVGLPTMVLIMRVVAIQSKIRNIQINGVRLDDNQQ